MQKYFFPLLLTGLLLFMAGCRQMTSDTTLTGEMPQEPTPRRDAMAIYDCSSIQITLPAEYLDQLIIEPAAIPAGRKRVCLYPHADDDL